MTGSVLFLFVYLFIYSFICLFIQLDAVSNISGLYINAFIFVGVSLLTRVGIGQILNSDSWVLSNDFDAVTGGGVRARSGCFFSGRCCRAEEGYCESVSTFSLSFSLIALLIPSWKLLLLSCFSSSFGGLVHVALDLFSDI